MRHILVAVALACLLASGCHAQPAAEREAMVRQVDSAHGPVTVSTVASGLAHPWAIAFLPDGGMLVTERVGNLRRIGADGAVSAPLAGVPAVVAEGQGGLLDVVLSPDFAHDGLVYLSYAEPGAGKLAGTAVARGRLDGDALREVEVIFRQAPKLDTRHHFGSRLVFDGRGHLFITMGDRGERPTAQDLSSHMGTVARVRPDGSVPDDNPFIGRDGVQPETWSYGHRNIQGAALHPQTGALWTHEHGPRGGDEINLPQPGRNYGWPIVTHGINYSGLPIPEAVGREREGMEPPHHVWEVSPGISGMAFYNAPRFAAWQGSLFIGAMAQRALIRLSLDGDRISGEERLLGDLNLRVRDVRVGPDGALYIVNDDPAGKLLRLELGATKHD
jgi:aldose sugar dehydrogenase